MPQPLPSNITIRAPATEEEFAQVWELRYKILREPWQQSRGSERSPEDDTQTHLAAFEDDKTVIATARLDDLGNGLAQIRCVAVSPVCQGRGVGSGLMRAMELLAWDKGFTELTLHARPNAVLFYTNLGFSFISPSYNLWDQIQHYEMRKSKPVEGGDGEKAGNSRDQALYALLQQSLTNTSAEATKALVDIFIQDIITKNKDGIKQSVATTPTNDGKVFYPSPK